MSRLIKLTIIPKSKKNAVKKLKDDVYEVHLKAKPEHNLANDLLIDFLAEYFAIPNSTIRILSGHHSHHKRVEIIQ